MKERDRRMKIYITYENPHAGEFFTLEGMQSTYNKEVDYFEYATFHDWLFDMLRSGVFECI